MLRLLTYTTLAALALVACKPTDGEPDDKPATPIESTDASTVLAEQLGAQLVTCECDVSGGYTDQAECVSEQKAVLDQLIDANIEGGATWDAQCAGELSKSIDQWSCLGPTQANFASSFDPRACPLLQGTQPEGSECNSGVLLDPCAAGLSCLAGLCVPSPQIPVPVGSPCEYMWDQLPCESGSWCAYDSNSDIRVCQALPALGDPCNPNEDYLCGPSSNDLICDFASSTCIAAPGEGEPCFDQFLCGPGTYCDGGKDFTCQPRRELGQGCGADSVCPVDAACINNICTADAAFVCSAPNWLF